MKKPYKIIVITLSSLYILYSILSYTKALSFSKLTSNSNEPNLKMNSKILSSNLVKYKIGDFIVIKFNDTLNVVHRLCAVENDILEIRDGVVFVNNKNFDENLNLIHRYKSSKDYFISKNIMNYESTENLMAFPQNDSIFYFLNDKLAKKLKIESQRLIDKKEYADQYINRVYSKNWNKDNFGPIKIDKGKLFVLGDNRDNSNDSRYIGQVDISNFLGTVIFNK